MAAIGTRKLTVEIDGTAYTAQASNVRITSGESDSDFMTFEEAAQGGSRDYALAITLTQDMATGSLWRMIFDNAGDDVPYLVSPYGNAIPSGSEPHAEGVCTITEPDGDFLGGEANKSNTARMTIEVVFPCTAKPTLVTTP
jgi:hypothetical protein